jgi:hypothetical protein
MNKIRLTIAALALAASACAHTPTVFTVGAVNPRPTVAIGGDVGPVSIDLSKIPDAETPPDPDNGRHVWGNTIVVNSAALVIKDLHATLEAGFRNAVASHYSASPEGTTRLVLDSADIQLVDMPSVDGLQPPVGRFLTCAYRGRWLDPQGKLLSEVSGVAQPRFKGEQGPRHLEDVVEVMLENALKPLTH